MYFDKSLKRGILIIFAKLQDWRQWFYWADVRSTNEKHAEAKSPRSKGRLMDEAQKYRERRTKGFDF